MRLCGIISEYNPFHRGHEKHLSLARAASGADLIVCAMSGSFVQRGEPAVFDKWTRAACALMCGADAVIDLPLLTAVQSAEGFASGGVKLLAAAGVDSICFGAETDDLSLLKRHAQALFEEDENQKRLIRRRLGEGTSYPRARFLAANVPAELAQPGVLLGMEYIKALSAYPHIRPFVVKREGSAYHSHDIDAYLPSATAIRKAFAETQVEKALHAMPEKCAAYVRGLLEEGLVPTFPDAFDAALLHILRLHGAAYIAQMPDVSEGLENRIYAAAQKCRTRSELIARIKTKRYTYARISRILLYALLGITRDMTEKHNAAPVSQIRVLGARSPGVLSALSAACSVSLITSASPLYSALDAAVTDVWALSQTAPPFCDTGRDYTQRLLTDF